MKRALSLVAFLVASSFDVFSMPGSIIIRGNINLSGGDPGQEPVICAIRGDVIAVGENISIDHARIAGRNVKMTAKAIQNRASQIRAEESIVIDAKKQTHETVINKWQRNYVNGSNYAHAEGVSCIDECSFEAPLVVQKGKEIENKGIAVRAIKYIDQGRQTTNSPARAQLLNYSHTERDGLFSHAESDVRMIDDVLIPTRYEVGEFLSLSSGTGDEPSEITNSYTLIKADAKIQITKDVKRDLPVQERHERFFHIKSSGISFGGIHAPDPLLPLQSAHQAYNNENMVGFLLKT